MKALLKTLANQGDISYLSYYFAKFITMQGDTHLDSVLALSAALVSEANQAGDACVYLESYNGKALFDTERLPSSELPVGLNPDEWSATLLQSNCVGTAGQTAPLILDQNRLYLHRYWFYEFEVARAIRQRLRHVDNINMQNLGRDLDQLYPQGSGEIASQQKLAAALSTARQFAVISGGPGTGKTTTVINIISLLLSQQADIRISLAAPTGKAAARLNESIRLGLDICELEEQLRERIPTSAETIHRLLKFGKNGFRYSQRHPLPIDCLIIDEASMVDLGLMYRLVDALPEDARLILLGDRDQLASVAAGSVLADITGRGASFSYSNKQSEWLFKLTNHPLSQNGTNTPMADSIALLTKSYRFQSDSGIGRLAELVRSGKADSVIELLQQQEPELDWFTNSEEKITASMLDELVNLYQSVVQSDNVASALAAFEKVRILCAVHAGPFGVNEINQRINTSMISRGWINSDKNYPGKPILITANDYELELFNGDIGLLWPDHNQVLHAYFRDDREILRSIAIANLPGHEPGWAMTVHKSQGSEFDAVVLVLPAENQRRALSRELVYTAITRARSHLSIYASVAALQIACRVEGQRHSGLAEKLGWPEN